MLTNEKRKEFIKTAKYVWYRYIESRPDMQLDGVPFDELPGYETFVMGYIAGINHILINLKKLEKSKKELQ